MGMHGNVVIEVRIGLIVAFHLVLLKSVVTVLIKIVMVLILLVLLLVLLKYAEMV